MLKRVGFGIKFLVHPPAEPLYDLVWHGHLVSIIVSSLTVKRRPGGRSPIFVSGDCDAAIATVEKALLDLFHLTPGVWDADRMAEMRFQQTELVALDRLAAFAERMAKPRILHAVRVWRECCSLDEPGELL